MGRKKTRIGIVDDHQLLRRGVQGILEPTYKVILSSNTLSDLFTLKDEIDAVILDLNLDNLPGATVLDKVRKEMPDTIIVVYSMRDSIESIDSCFKSGANAFISKGEDFSHLLTAIEELLSGEEIYLDSDLSDQLNKFRYKSHVANPKTILRKKEFKVFLLYSKGMDVPEIADEMEMKMPNVYNYISVIQKKLDLPKIKWTGLAKRFGFMDDDPFH